MEVHTKIFTGALIMAALGGTPPLQAAEQPKRGANIEDLPIDASGTPTPQATKPPIAPPAENGEMIMVPRALWEKLLRDVEELKAKTGTPSTPSTTVPPLETMRTSVKFTWSPAAPSSFSMRILSLAATRYCLPPVLMTAYIL